MPQTPITATTHVTYTGSSEFPIHQKEQAFAPQCISQKLPQLQARLNAALRSTMPIVLDLDGLLQTCTDAKARVYLLEQLFDKALPTLVETFEWACRDESVRQDISSRLNTIVFFNSTGAASSRTLVVDDGQLLYTGAFNHRSGYFTQKELREFFETHYFAEERFLLNTLLNGIIPALQQQLDDKFRRHVPIHFDVQSAIGPLHGKERVEMARLLAEDAGFERLARKFTQQVDSWFKSSDKSSRTSLRSQNVVLPVVSALFTCVDQDPNNPNLAKISAIEFLPCDSLGEKQIFLRDPAGVEVPPTAMHTEKAPSSVTLVYRAAFVKGLIGLIPSKDVSKLLEAATRCEERSLMHRLIHDTAVEFQGHLTKYLQHPVTVEFAWDHIFPPTLTPAERHDIALTLGSSDSKNVLRPAIDGFLDIFHLNPESIGIMRKLNRIVIQSARDDGGADLQLVHDRDTDQETLVYTLRLHRGLSGCYDKPHFKQSVRTLYRLQTPKEDKGIGAAFQSLVGGLDRAGDRLARSFKKFGM